MKVTAVEEDSHLKSRTTEAYNLIQSVSKYINYMKQMQKVRSAIRKVYTSGLQSYCGSQGEFGEPMKT